MHSTTHLQPEHGALGDHLLAILQQKGDERFHRLQLVAAFAKQSGVSRLWDDLQSFRDSGGSINTIIGIDHQGTTIDAVEMLYEVSDHLYIVHSTSRGSTFHPKLYVAERPDRVVALIGSSNLTAGGLWTNMEVFVRQQYDLPDDAAEYQAIQEITAQLRDTSRGHIKLVDDKLMEVLRRTLPNENAVAIIASDTSRMQHRSELHAIFGTGPPARIPSPSRRSPATQVTRTFVRRVLSTAPRQSSPEQQVRGFWKKLSSWDVSITSAPGQIVIPKRFIDLFPPLRTSEQETVAPQREASLTVLFHGIGGSQHVSDARIIEYVPAEHQSRPNIEYRFTFRDRSINPSQLSQGDILIFLVTPPGSDHYFEIVQVPTTSSDYARFGTNNKRYDFL